MKKLFAMAGRFLFNPKVRFGYLEELGFFNRMSDERYLRKLYKVRMGEALNLESPRNFNEKLQWLKLNDRRPEYTMMVDKYRARDYIAEKIGKQYLIPLLGVWDSVDEIDFDSLPNQFVLKCNHNSGRGMCICRDKSRLNIPRVKRELARGMAQNYYLNYREWPYKDVPRKIIAEKYMDADDGSGVLTDYKFFCFHGKPKLMYISKDGGRDVKTDFFDMEFNRLPIRMKDENSEFPPACPECFEEMKKIAAMLSQGIPFLRVDFYYITGQVYVGELTFYHNSGLTRVRPEEWARQMGDWIHCDDFQKG